MTTNELAILYHLLAQCFSYPSNYLIESLKRLVGELRIESWDSGSQGQPILPIASFVRALAALDRRVIGDLQQEHARLFGKDGSTALCPAYAGAYYSDVWGGVLAQDAQRIYAAWRQDTALDRATHIETQLEFLAHLCRQADNEAAQLARQDFLHKRVLNWLPRFAADLSAATQFDFYRTTAQLLAAFLEIEGVYTNRGGGVYGQKTI